MPASYFSFEKEGAGIDCFKKKWYNDFIEDEINELPYGMN